MTDRKNYTRKDFLKTISVGTLGAVGIGMTRPKNIVGKPIITSFNLVIYGSTPSGLMAASVAARKGASVVIIEPGKFIGGAVAGGLSRADVGNGKTVGGFTRDFFERAQQRHGGDSPWHGIPHAYLNTFWELIEEQNIILHREERITKVHTEGNYIKSISTEKGYTYQGSVFIDATYEGDLMAKAGVGCTWGREGRYKYGESLAGVFLNDVRGYPREVMNRAGNPGYAHGAPGKISAYDNWGNLVSGVTESNAINGVADKKTQAYCFRICVTQQKGNMVPWPKPRNYNPKNYELLGNIIDKYPEIPFGRIVKLTPLAQKKYDLNAQGLFSTDYVGGNYDYPDGDYLTRKKIWEDHIEYTKGLFWYLSQDTRVPKKIREEARTWGLAKDEFVDNGHWPYQLYVREARRMRGEYVMTQQDLKKDTTKKDSICMGSFIIDAHLVQRVAHEDGYVLDDALDTHIDGINVRTKPYQIPYRSIIPKEKECNNLLVPVCMSASHVAMCSIRMEPVYMQMGHAAGNAAIQVLEKDIRVQHIDINYLQQTLLKEDQILSL